MGARLPPRLLPPGRRRAPPRRGGDRGLHRHGDAAGGARHRAPARPARAAAGGHRVRPAQRLVRGRPAGSPPEAAAGGRGAEGAGCPARPSSTRARARAPRRWPRPSPASWARRQRPTTPGSTASTRASVQRRFLADEARVIVATNAFGMGVDKPNVRTVVHAGTPASLEAYYQEAGRGGARRPARAGAAARREPRQGPARALHQARGGRRRAARGPGRAPHRGGGRRRPLRGGRRRARAASPGAGRTACGRCWATSRARG